MRISKAFVYEHTVTICVFVGFIVCGIFNQYVPILRYLSVIIVFILSLLFLSHAISRFRLPSEQVITFLIFLALVQLCFSIVRNMPVEFSFFLAIMIGFLLRPNINFCVKLIYAVNILTIIVMIYELSSLTYLVSQVNSKFEFGRLQGLFSNSKEAGYYAIAATFYLIVTKRFTSFNLFALFLIAILSGTRTAILFIIAVGIIKIFFALKSRFTKHTLTRYFVILSVSLLFSYVLMMYYFTGESIYMLHRITNSFNFQSSSHLDRLFFWNAYLEGINSYNFYEIVFGAGIKLNIIIGNGAESFYLMIFSQFGLITLTAIVSVFSLIYLKLTSYEEKAIFSSLLIILFVGRIGTGWADGILMWASFFHVLDSNKRLKTNAA